MTIPNLKDVDPDLGIETVGISPGGQFGSKGEKPPQRIEGNLFAFVGGELTPVTPFGFMWEDYLLNNDIPLMIISCASMPYPVPDGAIRIITEVRWRCFVELGGGEQFIANANGLAYICADDSPIYKCEYTHNSPPAPIFTTITGPTIDEVVEKADLGIIVRENSSLGIVMQINMASILPGAITGHASVTFHVYVRGIQIRKSRDLGRGKNFNVQVNINPLTLAEKTDFWNNLVRKYEALS